MLLILNFLLHLTFIPHKKNIKKKIVYKSKNIALIVSIFLFYFFDKTYCININYTKSGYGNSQLVECIIKPHI